jgi:hypothetical protein
MAGRSNTKKAFEQYDAVDARNRLAASELERRWNGKLEEIEAVKQRLSRCAIQFGGCAVNFHTPKYFLYPTLLAEI